VGDVRSINSCWQRFLEAVARVGWLAVEEEGQESGTQTLYKDELVRNSHLPRKHSPAVSQTRKQAAVPSVEIMMQAARQAPISMSPFVVPSGHPQSSCWEHLFVQIAACEQYPLGILEHSS
jgi:hypothetical protein